MLLKKIKKKIYSNFINFLILILSLINKLFYKSFKNRKDFFPILSDRMQKYFYFNRNIEGIKINFFCPSEKSYLRMMLIDQTQQEVFDWVKNFKSDSKIIFWDIGSNVGIYAIFASLKYENIETFAIEPSFSNTRVLSRNISLNNLSDKISIIQLPLSNQANKFVYFNETIFTEGGALSFLDYENKSDYNYEFHVSDTDLYKQNNKTSNRYKLVSSSIDDLIEKNLLKIPTHIKIDVDGLEKLILEGGKKMLQNEKVREIVIELEPCKKDTLIGIDNILKLNNFKLIWAKRGLKEIKESEIKNFKSTLNALYSRNPI